MGFFSWCLTLYFGEVSVEDLFNVILGFALALIILENIRSAAAAAERIKKQRRRGRESSDEVPLDIMEGILSRLPVYQGAHYLTSLSRERRSRFVGFGYDPFNDDYKVVRFYNCWTSGHHDHLAIFYSLRLNSWERIKHGNLCVGYKNDDLMMTDIWVMKEYGNDESWTKLFSIRGAPLSKPLTYIHGGEQVLLLSTSTEGSAAAKLIYYNLKKEKIEKKINFFVCFPELVFAFRRQALLCHESLVSLGLL
ncbi:F-box protein [Corchorus olitorius]|uniref:F-box protein n=1 Tax=Corchorus olitorius TaxID=93759 RepID=A0A1R3JQS7_9ROSI|nr:F-box protein [Corchorus olitorius]